MASSYEIAQMFAQQNQMFMGQGQMASSLGVPAPPGALNSQVGMGGGGVGAYGMGLGGSRGGFSYSQPKWQGYGPGNSIAGSMMSAGSSGIAGGSMLAGGAAMLGIGGGPMGWAAMGMAGASMAATSMATGGQQQSQINTMLGNQYQHFNPQSRSGGGFSRDDAKAIGDSIRSLSHIPDMMTDVEELTKIASKMKGTGLMQGVKSAAEFQTRFKEALMTIRDTAKILGTTMEEAEQFFSQSRGAGFYGRTAQLKNVVSSQFTSAVTGANMGQVMAAQQGGADMAMQFGARRGLGATAVNKIAQNIGLAEQEGRIREGGVEDVTGVAGPEGQLQLAQKMFSGMMRFGQTAPGRLAMAGMMKYENGRATGVDEDLAKRFNSGNLSVDELKQRAGRLSDKEKISFTARQSDLVASLAGQMGPGGAFGMMKGVLGEGRDEEATNLVMQRLTGMSSGEIDIAGGMQGVSGDGMSGMMAKMRQRQSQQKERTDPKAVMARIKTKLHSATLGKLEQAGADLQNAIAKEIDSFFDDVIGTNVSALTEEKAKTLAQAFSGGQGSEARNMLKDIKGFDAKSLKGGSGKTGLAGALGMIAIGPLGAGLSALRNSGGGESGLARMWANLGGEQTEGQQSEFINKMFGTGDATKQSGLAGRLGGNIAGKGAGAYVRRIASSDEFATKSAVEQMQALTGGLESSVKDVLGKLPAGFHNPDTVGKMDESTLENVMKGANLSDDEKSLIRSLSSASKNRVGGMNVFAQMAAASSGGAAKIMQSLAGGGGASLSAVRKNFAAAQQGLSGAIGETAAGFVSGGSNNAKAFAAAINNEKLADVITSGDNTDIKVALAEAGIKMSDKEIDGLKQSVKSFQSSTKDPKAAKDAMERYGQAANQLASSEFRKNLVEQGAALTATSGGAGGRMAAAQKAAGMALTALGEKGEGGIDDWKKAFASYSESFEGLSPEEKQQALESGGGLAQQAYGASLKAKKFTGKTLTRDQALKEFGVGMEDLSGVGFVEGKALSADQAKKLAQVGASQKGLVGAQGGDKPQETEQQKLINALGKLDKNQEGIATILATLSQDKEIQGKIQKVLSGMKENAGTEGKANPGS